MPVVVVDQRRHEVEEGVEVGLNETSHESGAIKIVEEFEKVKPKLHCPKCLSEIKEVVVGRRLVLYQPTTQPIDLVGSEPDLGHLVGCFSCLNFYTCSDNGCLNPFDFSPKRSETYINHSSPSSDEQKTVLVGNELCFTMFWVIEKEKNNLKPLYENPQPIVMSDQVLSPTPIVEGLRRLSSFGQVSVASELDGNFDILENESASLCRSRSFTDVCPGIASDHDDASNSYVITRAPSFDRVCDGRMMHTAMPFSDFRYDAQPIGRSNGVLTEIFKSIVYGGLTEVIASSSVVALAAAFDVSTQSIIALAIASLIGGICFITHNIWDLREDYHGGYFIGYNFEDSTNKYQELLGRVNNFPLHAFFVILSFLMFGMVPPVTYALSFHKTNDKDSTLVMVAIVSILCVLLLTTLKEYINRHTIFKSIKIVVCYAIMVVIMWIASYAAGNLLTKLMEKIELFNMSSNDGMSILPHATT